MDDSVTAHIITRPHDLNARHVPEAKSLKNNNLYTDGRLPVGHLLPLAPLSRQKRPYATTVMFDRKILPDVGSTSASIEAMSRRS
jgi:hypothetical protein